MCVRKTACVLMGSGERCIILARRNSGEKKNTETQRIHHLCFRSGRYVTFAWHLFHLQIYYRRDGFYFSYSLCLHTFFSFLFFLPPQDTAVYNNEGLFWPKSNYKVIYYIIIIVNIQH